MSALTHFVKKNSIFPNLGSKSRKSRIFWFGNGKIGAKWVKTSLKSEAKWAYFGLWVSSIILCIPTDGGIRTMIIEVGRGYYLSIFCAVYRNTQYHLLKDTLISFGLSLLTPLGFYLLPGIFRIPSLADKKNKKNYIFKFSQIIQIF